MIVLNDLYTGYSRNSPLLEGFNYQFDNKIYGILGESGCGKTTLLRTIAGLTKPLQGEVVINGVKENRSNKNGIYMLHQNYTSFDWMTCLDNVLIAKKVKGKVTEKDKENALKMLELVKLDEHVHKYPRQLSGGMRQRLALARTLFMQPQIILMDEPLSALDSVTRAEMQKLIIRMHKGINNTIIMVTHSTDEAAKAFFAGKIDVAGTWQPYLTQAENMTDSHILFSTANSTKLIMSGVIFRNDFAKKNPELVSKFIDGTLQAIDSYDKELEVLRNSMPMFNGMSDEDIVGMTMDAALATWANNMDILKEDAKTIYSNMCDVWTSIGEVADSSNIDSLFDSTYMESLRDKYETSIVNNDSDNESKVSVTEDNKQEILDTTALLTKSASVNFIINTAKFTDTAEASQTLNDFIDVAKMLDGTIIQIEGNTDPNPNTDPTDEANIMLSKQRAETVKQYFIANGISADRIIVVGNGSSNPIVENDTEEHRAMNRRTDVSFKCIE